MAKVLNVKTVDSTGATVNYNIDNPKDIPNPLSRASIVSAFQYGIDNNILVSSKGDPIVSVEQVAVTTSEKVIIQGEAVYVTPDAITGDGQSLTTETVTVNTMIQAASYLKTSSTTAYDAVFTSITSNTVNGATIQIEFTQPTGEGNETGVLRIIVNGKSINIPVTFSAE